MKGKTILIAAAAIVCACTTPSEKEPVAFDDYISLSTQKEVDDFSALAARASKAGEVRLGSVSLEGEDISDISGIEADFVDILTVKGTSLTSLSNTGIRKIGSLLELDSNLLLKTASDFTPTECEGDIYITSNEVLSDISFLLNFSSIGGKLVITDNPSLGRDDLKAGERYGFNVITSLIGKGALDTSSVILRNNHSEAATSVDEIGSLNPGLPDRIEDGRNYTVENGLMSEEVLYNYLDKSITEAEYLNSASYNSGGFWGKEDDTRMLLNTGAKFIGRAMYTWGQETKFLRDAWFEGAKKKIDEIHAVDPDVIFQAAIFEVASQELRNVPIPEWVFEAFGLEYEDRCFDWWRIKDPEGERVGLWGDGTCVPDVSQIETQMLFYYMAVKYIDCGIEAIHLGQVNLMASLGDNWNEWFGMRNICSKIRAYAKEHARRGFVLLDGHTVGFAYSGYQLFDFVSYPIRLKEVLESTKMEATIVKGYHDSIIGRTPAGQTPSGWYTDRLPYILEFDNGGVSTHPGTAADDLVCWGYDEISWIANLDVETADAFLHYGHKWFRENDPMGHLEMPGMRQALGADAKKNPYANNPFRCNMRSQRCPTGGNLENSIKDVWAQAVAEDK